MNLWEVLKSARSLGIGGFIGAAGRVAEAADQLQQAFAKLEAGFASAKRDPAIAGALVELQSGFTEFKAALDQLQRSAKPRGSS